MNADILKQLNEIKDKIESLKAGDFQGIDFISFFFEVNYSQISKLQIENITPFLDSMIKLIENQFHIGLDFNVFKILLSEGIEHLYQFLQCHIEKVPYPINNMSLISQKIEESLSNSDQNKEDESSASESTSIDQLELTDDIQLYQDFIEEASELLDNVEKHTLELEVNPLNRESIKVIFRAFHTIKGVSGFLNLNDIHFLSHEIETLLENINQNKIRLNSSKLDIILEFTDLMKELIQNVKDHIQNKPYILVSINKTDISNQMEEFIVKELEKEKKLGEIMIESGDINKADLQSAIFKQTTGLKAQKIGEILISDNLVKPRQVVQALRMQKGTHQPKITPDFEDKVIDDISTIRVSSTQFDNLLDIVGEVVIANNQLTQDPTIIQTIENNTKLEQGYNQLKRSISELQKITMTMRMVEIRQTFHKINRLVRDLSKKSKKPINLEIIGHETEIDRRIVDEIYEPLVHVVRNAIDHGIESKYDRKKKGKNETGKIILKAYHQSGNVVIEVQDDGQGINRDRILNKAIEKKIIEPDQTLSNDEIDNLIFSAGFSTAAKITDVSGRGVGLDIVYQKVQSLKGRIEVHSKPNNGCRFVLKIPLTTAIIDGMVTQIGNNQYVIPTIHIIHIFKLSSNDYFTYEKTNEMIHIRDKVVPLVRLYNLFNEVPSCPEPDKAILILVEEDEDQKCLMVDDILDKQEIVVKALDDDFKDAPGVSAGTILSNGNPGLILDIKGIFDLYEKSAKKVLV